MSELNNKDDQQKKKNLQIIFCKIYASDPYIHNLLLKRGNALKNNKLN